MKKHYLFLSVVLIAMSLFNLTLDIDSRGHYFGNGIVCGLGLSMLVIQLKKWNQTTKV
ncbi:MAG TPA: hypothetical protein PKN57_03385 [Saprospiraceae bacterium]|nr:hypothetical protein [Saprospiraceae bacterium]MCC6687782.1 hypothetical protein [Saprospiraceae bacterium]HMW74234.1 hypothetical protein [Saprospiraceae bacterium]HMX83672.1 hypothetical protein [Saprospiraceae bacterium]HMX84760.1 hypothetical protein [Saprospiraceae bacterium]